VDEQIARLELPETAMPELGGAARTLYARLATEGPLSIGELDAAALAALLSTGLAAVDDDVVDVLPPTGPLLELAGRHTRRAVAAHQALDDLATIWRSAKGGEDGVELLSGAAADRRSRQALAASEREVLALSIGPRAGKTIEPAVGLQAALDRGVAVRVVYHSRLFQNPSALAVAQACVAAGEQARVFPNVPVNMTIMDDFATLNVSYDNDEPIHLACVHNQRIVASLTAIFAAFWQLAMPLEPQNALTEAPAEFRDLIRLLSLGITDRAIARELGVSERTVGRRVTALQEHLGADTRFQLGLQIARRGWL